MADVDQVAQLISELGPQMDSIEEIEAVGPLDWAIGMENDQDFLLSYDSDENKIILTTQICLLESAVEASLSTQPDPELELCKLMLTYNSLWRESGGLRLALDEMDGNVIQLLDVSLDGLDVVVLSGIVDTFLDAASSWADSILVRNNEDESPTDESSIANLQSSGVRV